MTKVSKKISLKLIMRFTKHASLIMQTIDNKSF